jgi:type II secretory pathway component PulM
MGKIASLLDGFSRLGKRERRVLAGGALFLTLLAIWLVILSPLLDRMGGFDRKAAQKEREIVELKEIRGSYLKVKNHVDQIEQRIGQGKKDFSFPAFLENAAVESKVKNRMTTLRPHSVQTFENLKSAEMEVKLEDLTLAQAVDFISRLEQASEFLYIRDLHMRTRYGEPKNIDLTLTVSHYEKNQ